MLAARNWGDADKMMTLLTKERGKVKAAAFGCRRARSPLAGGMQVFNVIDVQLAEGRRADTVRQCSLVHASKRLASDIVAMAYGAFVAELAAELAMEHEPQQEMYVRLVQILAAFEERNPRITALSAAFQLLDIAGLGLRLHHCVHCGRGIDGDAWFSLHEGGALCKDCHQGDPVPDARPYAVFLRELIAGLVGLNWQNPMVSKVAGRALLQAEQILLDYLRELFGHPLKSLAFIQQVAGV